ncbi:transmembrane sensor [Luteibacter sp. Sphag1AF]|uniref:FecR family protein n=1 Tax=Luteibacter sp. Sphag1AF TaxID=2587031 RepID=UPI0016199B37|nr:FecR domain-containing protein [Luteibacter sp. Sphag1AF]MBB3226466.1 transmembrane sensor [Luteibacter sp. Sphag1AF]
MSASTPASHAHQRLQASRWAVTVRMETLSDDQLHALSQWLAADPVHAQWLARAESAWDIAGALRDAPPFAQAVPRARPWSMGAFMRGLFQWQPLMPVRWAGVAATIAFVWLAVAALHPLTSLRADYITGTGDIRDVSLPDGSHVTLGSDSALAVHYDNHVRRVQLLRGEAAFAPLPRTGNEHRRFIVDTADGHTTALGTRFLVQRQSNGNTWVGVLEHTVEVRVDETPAPATSQMTLGEGESAVYSAAGVVRSDIEPELAADWTQGTLQFDRVPLSQVVERLNHYRRGWVVLANTSAGQRPVSALFHIDNLDEAVTTLGRGLGLKVRSVGKVTVIY